MNLLYVEDELARNIPRIVRLFDTFLSERQKEKLMEFENDSSGYGADPEEIKTVVEEEGFIEVEYTFPAALRKVVNPNQQYALYLIDRNLSAFPYNVDEIHLIDKDYNPEEFNLFKEREGDYFLRKLIYNGSQIQSKLYFLTAYPAEHELKGLNDIKTHFDAGKFLIENFIEKGNEKALNRLIDIIKNHQLFNLKKENEFYLNSLDKLIDSKAKNVFFELLREKDCQKKINQNLSNIRILFENLMNKTYEFFESVYTSCVNSHGELNVSCYIHALKKEVYINEFLKSSLLNIWKTCSEYGGHRRFSSTNMYEPTTDTVNAMVYQLKDVITWVSALEV